METSLFLNLEVISGLWASNDPDLFFLIDALALSLIFCEYIFITKCMEYALGFRRGF